MKKHILIPILSLAVILGVTWLIQAMTINITPQELKQLKEQNFTIPLGSGGEVIEPTSVSSGATSVSGNVTYPSDMDSDWAWGGRDTSAPGYFDTSEAKLTVTNLQAGNATTTGSQYVGGDMTLHTTTASSINGTIVVDGVAYSQDGTGIQNAINDACDGTTPCDIYIPLGTYTMATGTQLVSNIHFHGAGQGKTILEYPNLDVPGLRTFQRGTTKDGYQNIEIDNLTIVAQNGHATSLQNINNLKVHDIEVYFSATPSIREALWIQHGKHVIINNVFVHDTAGNGIQLNAVDKFNVVNNIVSTSSDDAIDIDWDFLDTSAIYSNYGSVTGNTIKNVSGGNGIRVENSNEVAINGNHVSDVVWDCIIANNTGSSMQGISISGNEVNTCQKNGISVSGSNMKATQVTGNAITSSALNTGSDIRSGIRISATSTSVISNSVFDIFKGGDDGGGIVIYKADDVFVSNNTIASTTNGINVWTPSEYASTTIIHNYFNKVTTEYVGETGQDGVYIQSMTYGDNGQNPLIGFGLHNPTFPFEFGGNVNIQGSATTTGDLVISGGDLNKDSTALTLGGVLNVTGVNINFPTSDSAIGRTGLVGQQINFGGANEGIGYGAAAQTSITHYFTGGNTFDGVVIKKEGTNPGKPFIIKNSSDGILFEVSKGGNATTTGYFTLGTVNPQTNMSAGDMLIGGDLSLYGGTIDMSTSTPTTTPGFFVRPNNTATSTVSIGRGTANPIAGCIEMIDSETNSYVRVYVSGGVLRTETGRCKD